MAKAVKAPIVSIIPAFKAVGAIPTIIIDTIKPLARPLTILCVVCHATPKATITKLNMISGIAKV